MKYIIITLISLLMCGIVSADMTFKPKGKKLKIGQYHEKVEIVGGINDQYLEGCDKEIGFHFGASEIRKGVFRFVTYCGPAPKGKTHYTILRDEGI